MPYSDMKDGDDKDKDNKNDANEVAIVRINPIDKNHKLKGLSSTN